MLPVAPRRSHSSRASRVSPAPPRSTRGSLVPDPEAEPPGVQNYCRTVELFSQRSQNDYLHSGYHFYDLAKELAGRRAELESAFATAIQLDGNSLVRQPLLTQQNALSSANTIGPGCSQLLFLRGYPSYKWLALLGDLYSIDPEFWRRHIPKRKSTAAPCYDLPILPSYSQHVVQLRVSTIFHRKTGLDGSDDKKLRGGVAVQNIEHYHNQLVRDNLVGASMVRQLHTHSSKIYTVEQYISFTIVTKADGWAAVVWLDSGTSRHPLPARISHVQHQEESGPDLCFPVLQRGPQMTAVRPDDSSATSAATAAAYGPTTPTPVPAMSPSRTQSAMLLPEQYADGGDVDTALMRASPLYALGDVFRLAACSSSQVVNMLTTQVEGNLRLSSDLRPSSKHESEALANLQYTKFVLDDHAAYLAEIVALLDGSRPGWAIHTPTTNPGENQQQQHPPRVDVEAAVDRLQAALRDDFACLLRRTERLAGRCKDGVDIILSSAQLRESLKGISQASEVGRLSKLIIIFAPLSFLTSFFGMNFLEMKLKVGLSIVLGVSVLFCVATWWVGLFSGILRQEVRQEGEQERRSMFRQHFADP